MGYKNAVLCSIVFFITSPLFAAPVERWYSPQQVDSGNSVFQKNCASCHGQNAASIANWKQTDANGNYPPPPLNGSAHAWHHDLPLLQRTVREGGQKLGGLMPPFEKVLTPAQIDTAIAYFQSKWSDDIYAKWAGRFNVENIAPSLYDLEKLLDNKPNTRYLKQRLGNTGIGQPKQSAIKDLYEIKFNGKTLYLTEDGQYAIIGEMIDLKNGINLSK